MTSINFTYGSKHSEANLETPNKKSQSGLDHSLVVLSK